MEELKKTWMSKLKEDCLFISAKDKENIDELKKMIYDKAKDVHISRFPYNDFLFYNYEEEADQLDEFYNKDKDESEDI